MNRLFDSENRINSSAFVWLLLGTLDKSRSIPNPPANAISAHATPIPPSEQSWHDLISRWSIAWFKDWIIRFPVSGRTIGTLFPTKLWMAV